MVNSDARAESFTCAGCGKVKQGKLQKWEQGFSICSEECCDKIVLAPSLSASEFVYPQLS